jgi:hypothetical protein
VLADVAREELAGGRVARVAAADGAVVVRQSFDVRVAGDLGDDARRTHEVVRLVRAVFGGDLDVGGRGLADALSEPLRIGVASVDHAGCVGCRPVGGRLGIGPDARHAVDRRSGRRDRERVQVGVRGVDFGRRDLAGRDRDPVVGVDVGGERLAAARRESLRVVDLRGEHGGVGADARDEQRAEDGPTAGLVDAERTLHASDPERRREASFVRSVGLAGGVRSGCRTGRETRSVRSSESRFVDRLPDGEKSGASVRRAQSAAPGANGSSSVSSSGSSAHSGTSSSSRSSVSSYSRTDSLLLW